MNQGINYYLKEARNNGWAVGHFNFATEDVAQAIVEGTKEARAYCVMLGTSEGEADFFGLGEAVAVTRAIAQHYHFPVFLNADHFRSFEKCKQAIDAGYDSVILDPRGANYEEKVEMTKKVVEYARNTGREISVEGELGYLKGSSEVQTKIEISSADFTKPEEVKDFVSRTGVDRLAIVFGNVHGIVTEQDEKLDIEHFQNIIATAPEVFYVLHGASGLSDDDVRAAIKAGISNVHFNTELRVAYHDTLQRVFHNDPHETTPYKYLSPAAEEVKKIVTHKTRLFMGL